MPKLLIEIIAILAISTVAGGFLYWNFRQLPAAPPEEIPQVQEESKRLPEEIAATLKEVTDRLHTQGSGPHLRNTFTDLELVYTDDGAGSNYFPDFILPFGYYYSKEVDRTFNVCAIDLTVFICEGKLDRLLTKADIDSGRCNVTSAYLGDKRLK